MGALVVVSTLLVSAISGCRTAEFRNKMVEKGFPYSYAKRLAEVHRQHPNWTFEPLMVNDLTWSQIVTLECTESWNLVAYATWATGEWNRLGDANYTPYYAKDAKAYDSGAWYQASREAIAYFMDPRNFLNESEIFMFETLQFDEASQTEPVVELTLANTFMSKANYDGGDRRFSSLIVDIGKKLGVNPVFLAGRLASEQGMGSPQALGTIGDMLFELYNSPTGTIGNAQIWGSNFTKDGTNTAAVIAAGKDKYNGYYNFFNSGAYGSGVFEIKYNAWREAVKEDTCKKYRGPWTSQALAIEGGSIRIKERYVDTHRHTRYLQKFSVLPQAGEFRWKQYMQNIAAPLVEARNAKASYDATGALDAPYKFLIPVYVDMPEAPSPDPANGNSVYSSH